MNSPVQTYIISSLTIDKANPLPIYRQIAEYIIKSIQQKNIPHNTVLPGTRTLSKLIGIHRNTVTAAYEELENQGWAKIISKKGVFAQSQNKKNNYTTTRNTTTQSKNSFTNTPQLLSPYEEKHTTFILNDGKFDARQTLLSEIAKWHHAIYKRKGTLEKFQLPYKYHSTFFENQLINFLKITQEHDLQNTNLFTCTNKETALFCLLQILIKPKDIVAIPELNHFSANMILQQTNATIHKIPLSEHGIDITHLEKQLTTNPIKCLYIASNGLYPTHWQLPLEQKKELLKLSNTHHFHIIEEQTTPLLHSNTTSEPTLYQLDHYNRVFQLSSFGEFLPPTLQLGVLIGEKNHIKEIQNFHQIIADKNDIIKEQILAEMLHEGEIMRQYLKAQQLYAQRQNIAQQLFQQHFQDELQICAPTHGFALWCTLKDNFPLIRWSENAKLLGITFPKHLLYHTKKICGFRFGYGSFNETELETIIPLLKQAYLQTKN